MRNRWAGAAAALLMAGCGGGGHRAATRPPAPGSPSAGTASAPAQAPRTGLASRLLTANELPGFSGNPGLVAAGASNYLTDSGATGSQLASETKWLRSCGFVRGVREDLTGPGSTSGLSFVEQFHTPQGARRELANQARGFKTMAASQGTYTPLAVPGIPGAVGFGVLARAGQPGGGINVTFAKGPFYYLVGEVIPSTSSSKAAIASLVRAAQHLYARVGA